MGISAEDYGAFKHHLGATLEKFKVSVVDSIGQAGASTWRFTPQMYTLKLNYPHRAESHRYLVARRGVRLSVRIATRRVPVNRKP